MKRQIHTTRAVSRQMEHLLTRKSRQDNDLERPTRSDRVRKRSSGLAETLESVITGLDPAIQILEFARLSGCPGQAGA